MSETRTSAYSMAGAFGVIVLALTVLLSMVYWMDEISATMEAVPRVYYVAFVALWVGASGLALVRGGEGTRQLGAVLLIVMMASVGMATALTLPEYIEPILRSWLPNWPPYLWAVFAVGAAISLLAFAIVGPYLSRSDELPIDPKAFGMVLPVLMAVYLIIKDVMML